MQIYSKIILGISLLIYSAEALEVTSLGGDARFYYGSTDSHNNELLKKAGATGQFALAFDADLNVSNDVKINLGSSLLSTMGLEESVVTYTFAGGTTKDQLWLDEVNFEVNFLQKSNATLGRQYISSPLLYSIDWNIVSGRY